MNPFGPMVEALTVERARPEPPAVRTKRAPVAKLDAGVVYEVVLRTTYRPTGAPAALLRVLAERKQATSGELAAACGIRVCQVCRLMSPATRFGLVRFRTEAHKRHWEWVGS